MANNTAGALLDLASEQKQIKQTVLQHHIVLDLLLAAEGSVCAVVGQECCVFIPDTYNSTWNRAHHIRTVAKDMAGKLVVGFWANLFSWFPDVGG